MKNIIVAESAGFCFGVSRAVDLAEKALDAGGEIWCLGELIHNRSVVEKLEARGMKTASAVSDIPDGAQVIIRSHGVGKAIIDELAEKNCTVINCTCPRVLYIHKLVQQAEAEGRKIIIIGEKSHPEVEAICGWCSDAEVFSGAEEFEKWSLEDPKRQKMEICVVFQTTSTQISLTNCKLLIKKLYTNGKLFDTICDATFTRQKEAMELADRCDAMIVIGGHHSANSVHLAELCSERCGCVQFVESAQELNMSLLRGYDTIGITAGASAPAWIIKEVKQQMSDEIKFDEIETQQKNTEAPEAETVKETAEVEIPAQEEPVAEVSAAEKPDSEKTFDELLEDSIKTIYNGDTVTGIVAAITPTEISVDLGTKHSGYIPVSEFTDDADVKLEDVVKVGDTIEACVVRVNDVEGTVKLSKKRLDAVKNWADIEQAKEDETVVEGTVTEENKGGVVVSVKGVRVFVPASQSGLGRDVPMTELVGQKVRLRINEVNRSRRRVVGSIRAVTYKERREKAEKIWNEIEVGARYHGVVKSLTSYGAFVDIGGIDGMVHVSQLSWSRIKQPSDVLSVGDEVEVYVISFDKEKKKISLGYRDPDGNPWVRFTSTYNVGDVASVRIVKLVTFGAFAEVMPGVDGLIHISQIANRRIGKPEDVLSVDEVVEAKITNIDNEKQKISLSIRALSEPEPAPARREEAPAPKPVRAQEDALVYEISASGEVSGVAPEVDEDEAE
jgi:4-hydroxy-3-methylbut-2-enyl diphosphate reductase